MHVKLRSDHLTSWILKLNRIESEIPFLCDEFFAFRSLPFVFWLNSKKKPRKFFSIWWIKINNKEIGIWCLWLWFPLLPALAIQIAKLCREAKQSEAKRRTQNNARQPIVCAVSTTKKNKNNSQPKQAFHVLIILSAEWAMEEEAEKGNGEKKNARDNRRI